ncbi:hypothetical protein BGAL_0083g00130 [Botrytis galanthina]|uniref:Uncharacterized protein n=1 Tax=Botrytis galanthina TaxID=278940 RepID=A0A4S8R497_9HELO|nr:hypothetical protein BGAL_0083g00130 [Botrytis galanthina]
MKLGLSLAWPSRQPRDTQEGGSTVEEGKVLSPTEFASVNSQHEFGEYGYHASKVERDTRTCGTKASSSSSSSL